MVLRVPAVVATLLTLFARAELAALEREEAHRFAVGAAASLEIETFDGSITVKSDDVPEIRIRIFKEGSATSNEKFDEFLRKLSIDVARNGDAVRIKTSYPGKRASFSFRDWPPIGLTFEVSVPRTVSLNLSSGNGSITLGEVSGPVKLRTGQGTLFCRFCEKDITATNDRGDVVVSRALGDVSVRTANGAIRLGTVGGRATLVNQSGDIDTLIARGGVNARAEAGDIEIGFPRRLNADSNIRTSGGSIRLSFDPSADAIVDASSVWGKVISKLPLVSLQGAVDSRRFRGRLNAGGPVVTAHADGGYVRIEGRPDAFVKNR